MSEQSTFGESPQDIDNKLYWFLRDLCKSDYGSIHTENVELLRRVSHVLARKLENDPDVDEIGTV
jgi:hypothetical protein